MSLFHTQGGDMIKLANAIGLQSILPRKEKRKGYNENWSGRAVAAVSDATKIVILGSILGCQLTRIVAGHPRASRDTLAPRVC